MSGRFSKYWLPLILWMMFIFGASTRLGAPDNTSYFFRPIMHFFFPHISEERYDLIHHCVRKTAHFVEYAMLGILVWRVVQTDPLFASFSPRRRIGFALLFCMFYASTDEFHQVFVPAREAAVRDVLLDTSGSACALLAIWSAGKLRGSAIKA
ncbi:MAG TPA: VanZ family protein [Verrucomicrobiae bacterium]